MTITISDHLLFLVSEMIIDSVNVCHCDCLRVAIGQVKQQGTQITDVDLQKREVRYSERSECSVECCVEFCCKNVDTNVSITVNSYPVRVPFTFYFFLLSLSRQGAPLVTEFRFALLFLFSLKVPGQSCFSAISLGYCNFRS